MRQPRLLRRATDSPIERLSTQLQTSGGQSLTGDSAKRVEHGQRLFETGMLQRQLVQSCPQFCQRLLTAFDQAFVLGERRSRRPGAVRQPRIWRPLSLAACLSRLGRCLPAFSRYIAVRRLRFIGLARLPGLACFALRVALQRRFLFLGRFFL